MVNQFTFIGAPQIWNGEESGMWGADDPDCRKPLIWDDLSYEAEKAAFDPSVKRRADTVRTDKNLLGFYRKLCKMRKENPVLSDGELSFLTADDKKMLLAYKRYNTSDEIIVVFNCSEEEQKLQLSTGKEARFEEILGDEGRIYETGRGYL